MEIMIKPKVNVVVDKVRFTYIVPKTKINIFYATLQYIFFAKEIFKNKCQVWKNKYTSQVRVYFEDDNYLFVQASTNHGNLYVAVEFNASNLTNEKWERLQLELESFLPDGYFTLFYEGKVSFIEIAVDVKHVKFEETKLIDYKLRTLNELYKEDGTLYLGNENGARSFTVYDKAKQLEDVKGIILDHALLRIEARVRPESLSPQNLQNLENPFTSLFVFNEQSANAAPNKGKVWTHLKNGIFNLGIEPQQAYLSLPKGSRLAVHSPLFYSKLDWWDANYVWGLAIEAIKGLQPEIEYLPTLG